MRCVQSLHFKKNLRKIVFLNFRTTVGPRLLGQLRPKISKNRGIANFRFTTEHLLTLIIGILNVKSQSTHFWYQ